MIRLRYRRGLNSGDGFLQAHGTYLVFVSGLLLPLSVTPLVRPENLLELPKNMRSLKTRCLIYKLSTDKIKPILWCALTKDTWGGTNVNG